MESPGSFQYFKLAQFRFFIKALDRLHLPAYKGSALRGGFGHAFKKVVCVLKSKGCPECLLRGKCVYAYVFETPPPADSRMMRKYPSVPHPFVLLPPLENDRLYEPGEKIQFQLTLIGKAIDYLPYFIYTFEELGKMGLGKGRGKFKLEEVEIRGERSKEKGQREELIYSGDEKVLRMDLSPLTFDLSPSALDLYPFTSHLSPSTLHLFFITPTRLKFQGDLTSDLHFHILFRNLLRRISLLSYFHCGFELDVDFRGLIRESTEIQTKKTNLRWFDWERYSARQEEKMKLGGFMGKIIFSGDLTAFWPYLILGEFVHVGKGTSFGLGKYEILNKD